MRLVNKPRFDTSQLEPLWSSHVDSVQALRNQMQGSTLVAIDVEGTETKTTELGLAVLVVNENNPHYCDGRAPFHEQNQVQAFTFELKTRIRTEHGLNIRRDAVKRVGSDPEAAHGIEKVLRMLRKTHKLILVGYDMYLEFGWLANSPSLAAHFSAWCDVQEFMAIQHAEGTQIGLMDALRGMQIRDASRKNSYHSAANDAVRSLAILAALLEQKDFVPASPPSDIITYNFVPPRKRFRPQSRLGLAVWISTDNGQRMPLRTPKDLIQMYGDFDLTAVGMRPHTILKTAIRWWIAFKTVQSMQEFIEQVDGSEVDGHTLVVRRRYWDPPNVSDSSSQSSDDAEVLDGIRDLFLP